MTREQVRVAVEQERVYQKEKWGDLDERNSMGDFLIYMQQRLDAAKAGYSGPGMEAAACKFVQQVTALGEAALEKFGAPGRGVGVK